MNPTWIIHYIPCSQPSYHTHGLDRYGSLELELNLPLVPHQASRFINLIANQVAEKGKRYCTGDREDDVFTLPFYLFETSPIQSSRENDRVLRILFCDPDKRYPWEPGCKKPYSEQLNAMEKREMAELMKNGKKESCPRTQ